ncbi:MAG: hypothetical protein HS126_29350 [Anaerolineales bacterium]|nr:hypothetical protein [Anaerolineales bacterium]
MKRTNSRPKNHFIHQSPRQHSVHPALAHELHDGAVQQLLGIDYQLADSEQQAQAEDYCKDEAPETVVQAIHKTACFH